MEYIIGIDISSTTVRVAAFSEEGQMKSIASEKIIEMHPRPQWREISSVQIWNSVCSCLQQVAAQVGKNNIKGIGISSIGESGIPLDENGESLYSIIAWYDNRAAEQANELEKNISARRIYEITGQFSSAKFGLPKFLWIRDNYPDIFMRCKHWVSMEDFIIYRLTGEFVTDYTIAARTMAFEFKNSNGLRKFYVQLVSINRS